MDRVFSLFGYETNGGRDSVLWNEPYAFVDLLKLKGEEYYELYQVWTRSKRRFALEEVLTGYWAKVSDHGHNRGVRFHPDGTLTEWDLFSFDEEDSWGGEWQLFEGVLLLNIKGYELEVFASRGGLHSGIEDYEDRRNAYFRVLHITTDTPQEPAIIHTDASYHQFVMALEDDEDEDE